MNKIIPDGILCKYVFQEEPLGLGHAILQAKPIINDEPFAVILADDLIDAKTGVLRQMVDLYRDTKSSIISVHKIDKAYGDVLISSNMMHTSQMTQEETKSFTDAVHIEMSFDIQNHTISILVGKKPGIPKEFSEHLDKQVEEGNLLFSLQDTCDVENTYDPMKEKKLLKEIGF